MIHIEVYNLSSHTCTHTMYFSFVLQFLSRLLTAITRGMCSCCLYIHFPILSQCYQKIPWVISFLFFFDTDLVSDKLILILGVLRICQRFRKTETMT